MKKIYFIINPLAKNGYGLSTWNKVEEELEKRGIPFQAFFTMYHGHAIELARSIAENVNGETVSLVAVGGDGTLHEIINGIIKYPNIVVGVIPAGSGNDFSRGLFIPKDPLVALDHIISKAPFQPEYIDVGKMINYEKEEQYFVNNMGAGFDAEVAQAANRSRLKALLNRYSLGMLIYVMILLKKLASFRCRTVEMTIDGKDYTFPSTWFVTVANQPYYGGGMLIAPSASPTDGKLNIIVVNNLSKLKLLAVFISVFWGGHTRFKEVTTLKGENIKITTSEPLLIHLDGEIKGYTPITVQVVNKSLSIIVNKDNLSEEEVKELNSHEYR